MWRKPRFTQIIGKERDVLIVFQKFVDIHLLYYTKTLEMVATLMFICNMESEPHEFIGNSFPMNEFFVLC